MLMGINFSKAIGTQCFFHIALQFFLIVCLKSDVELNSRFVFYFKCIPYRLWHKWGVYHSVSPCPMIHKETPFTDCQQIKSLGEQGLRVLRFRVSWGWAGTGACGIPGAPLHRHTQTLYLGNSFSVWTSKGQTKHLKSASWTVFALDPAVNSFILTVESFFSALMHCLGSRKREIPREPGRSWGRLAGVQGGPMSAGSDLVGREGWHFLHVRLHWAGHRTFFFVFIVVKYT